MIVEHPRSKSPATSTVIIICPGGLENGGGIGRQMGYFLQGRRTTETAIDYRIIDSRGPWFLGASPVHIGFAGFYLLGAAVKLCGTRLQGAHCIVHVNITGRGSTIRKVILLAFVRALRLQYILHVHDYDYAEEYRRRGSIMKGLIKSSFRKSAKVLVLGDRERARLSELLGLRESQILVLPNAVPDPIVNISAARKSGRPCHLLFLGHLSARKGVPELLRALASPALADRPWRATLAGGGSIDEFRRLANELGIADRIDLPGWLGADGVRALCTDADVLVLPSHAEGLAMAVLEGLSYGLAVVTTPVGAHPEVIEPEVSGIMVPAGDVEALASALARVIDDDCLRERLRAGARRRFLEKFDVRTYAERLGELHANLLSGAGT